MLYLNLTNYSTTMNSYNNDNDITITIHKVLVIINWANVYNHVNSR